MKTPESSNENSSGPNNANFKPLRLTPRQVRVVQALMACNGWISREHIDRIAGASNGPQIIKEIRHKLTGYEGLDMSRIDALDRDGKPCKPGCYQLNSLGRSRVKKLLER